MVSCGTNIRFIVHRRIVYSVYTYIGSTNYQLIILVSCEQLFQISFEASYLFKLQISLMLCIYLTLEMNTPWLMDQGKFKIMLSWWWTSQRHRIIRLDYHTSGWVLCRWRFVWDVACTFCLNDVCNIFRRIAITRRHNISLEFLSLFKFKRV